MSTTTAKLSAYAKEHKFVTGCIVTGVVALIAIGGVLAWNNDTKATDTAAKPVVTAAKDNDKKEKGDTTAKTDTEISVTGETATNNAANSVQATGTGTQIQLASTAVQPTETPAAAPVTPGRGAGEAPVEPIQPVNPVIPPATPPTTSANLIANGDLETVSGSTPAGFSADSWGNNVPTFTYPAPGHTGNGAQVSYASYVADPTNGGDAKWTVAAISVTAGKSYQFSDFYKSDTTTQVDYFDATSGNWLGTIGQAPASADWTQFKGQFTATATGTIRIAHILSGQGSLTTDDYSLSEYTPVAMAQGMVTLTFDDGWRSIYTGATQLLKDNNLVSTLYMLSDTLQNNGNYPDYMTVDEAKAMQANGNEIGSHTVHHCDLSGQQTEDAAVCPTPLPEEMINSELTVSKAYLEQAFGVNVTSFASPYGGYTGALDNIQAAGYTSHRSVETGYNSVDSFDAFNIKVQNILDATTPAEVQLWIDQAIANKTWLVLVYHEVKADTNAGLEDYSVTPANLATELGYLGQQQAAGNVQVKTMRDALAIMQASKQ